MSPAKNPLGIGTANAVSGRLARVQEFLRANRPDFPIRYTGRPLRTCRSGWSHWSLRTGITLRSRWSGITLRPLGARITLRSLGARITLRSGRSRWSLRPRIALRPLGSGITLRSLRARITLRSLRTRWSNNIPGQGSLIFLAIIA